MAGVAVGVGDRTDDRSKCSGRCSGRCDDVGAVRFLPLFAVVFHSLTDKNEHLLNRIRLPSSWLVVIMDNIGFVINMLAIIESNDVAANVVPSVVVQYWSSLEA